MNELVSEKNDKVETLIYEIRGKQVMLDSDLARLYECKNGTKTINQAVGRHKDRFPEDFIFNLSQEEFINICGPKLGPQKNMIRSLPYAFTEQGVAMLATILRTPVASEVSIRVMRVFVAMRKYVGNSYTSLSGIESKLMEHDRNIKSLQEVFNKFEEKKRINEIYFNGQIYDAYSKILDIFMEAKNDLIIIDAYADKTILDIIRKLKVDVTLIRKKNKLLLSQQDINRYNAQYKNLKVINNDTFYDRYFILDKKQVYHCGTSINKIGSKTFSITLIGDEEVKNVLINRVNEIVFT